MGYVEIRTTITMDETELWCRVWGADPYNFGTWWREVEWLDGADWNKVGDGVAVTLTDDPDVPDGDANLTTKVITVQGIAEALSDPAFPDHLRQRILYDDADCIDADAVIQWIVFGEVLFG